MADSVPPLLRWREQAIAAQDNCFGKKVHGRRLSHKELARFRKYFEVTAGWRTSIEVEGQQFELDVIVDSNFPFSLPKLFLANTSKFLVWPHIEKNDRLCLVPDHASFRISTDDYLLLHMLDLAKSLIADNVRGDNRNEFVTEFSSYWNYGVSEKLPEYWSLLKPKRPSREISCWASDAMILLSEDVSRGNQWLDGFLGKPSQGPRNFISGLFLWLNQPVYPDEYPRTNADIRKLAAASGQAALDILYRVIKKSNRRFPIVIGLDTENGPVLAGLMTFAPMHSIPNHSAGGILVKGYRRGKEPPSLLANRYLTSTSSVEPRKVVRCDRAWIHERGGDGLSGKLFHKSVVLIGCGALGCLVATQLAQAGVGQITLIDNDNLSWSNVGRHVLGGPEHIGKSKARGLAAYINRNLPHLKADAINARWQTAQERDKSIFENCDVVISTTGEWASDAELNFLGRRSARFPPIVFGWTEAYASAGHALAVLDLGGCLSCGMNDLGEFRESLTSWKNKTQMRREPGCGGVFQPFGTISLAPIASLIGKTTVDLLNGMISRSHHRTWAGSAEIIKENGGSWSNAWVSKFGDPGDGGKIIRSDWLVDSNCNLCLT